MLLRIGMRIPGRMAIACSHTLSCPVFARRDIARNRTKGRKWLQLPSKGRLVLAYVLPTSHAGGLFVPMSTASTVPQGCGPAPHPTLTPSPQNLTPNPWPTVQGAVFCLFFPSSHLTPRKFGTGTAPTVKHTSVPCS